MIATDETKTLGTGSKQIV